MSTIAIELIYRGVFQKVMAQRICRGIVLAARKEGKVGVAFSRYGDSPERNGIPAKQFAVVADDPEELQALLAMYQPRQVDVSIVLDDTLCKGVESWAWDGLHPVNSLLRENGTLVVISAQSPDELLEDLHHRETSYDLAILKREASFSGLWVFRDDHSDVCVLGALARVCPELVSLASVEEAVLDQGQDQGKVDSARRSFDEVQVRKVEPGRGSRQELFTFEPLTSPGMEEALVVRGAPAGGGFRGGEGGFQSGRNPYFKKYTARTTRPVVDFDRCTRCSQCWLLCPDGALDVAPEGHYDVNMEACPGCGVCAEVCPVKGCITMVNEAVFTDNASQYEMWEGNKAGYKEWLEEVLVEIDQAKAGPHGFHHWGEYGGRGLQGGGEP